MAKRWSISELVAREVAKIGSLKDQTAPAAIPDVTQPDLQALHRAFKSVKAWIDAREGSGAALNRVVTVGDLVEEGLATLDLTSSTPLQSTGGSGSSGGGTGYDDGRPVLTTPPTPTGLTATGTFRSVFLEWSLLDYQNHAYTEVWRATTNTLGSAVLIGTSVANLYVDANAAVGVTYYYWVRAVGYTPGTTTTVTGAYNAVGGTSGGVQQIGNADLANLIVDANKLANGAVTNAKLASAAVGLANFAAGITPVEIVGALPGTGNYQGRMVFLTTDNKLYRYNASAWTAAVPAADITGQITGTQITDGAISTPKLAAGSVTSNELAANSVVAGKIAAGAVSATELAANSVVAGKIAAGAIAVGSAAIANGAISNAMIANAAIDNAKIASLAVATANIQDGAITTVKIGDAQVTNAKIGSLAVGTANIQDAAITTVKVGDAQITNAKIANLDAGKITTGTLDANRVAANSLNANKIQAGTITTDRLVANAATAVNYADVSGSLFSFGSPGSANTSADTTDVVVTTTGSPVWVFATIDFNWTPLNTAAVQMNVTSSLRRDGAVLKSLGGDYAPLFTISGGKAGNHQMTFFFLDNAPPAGSHAYDISFSFGLRNSSNASVTPNGGTWSYVAYIGLLENKV